MRNCMLSILWVACALAARAGLATERATSREACEALSGLEISAAKIGLPTSGARIDSSRFVSATAEGNVNGEFCEVTGWILPVNASSPRMLFEVNLPSSWNRKLLQMGGGGFDGSLVTGLGAEGLQPKSVAHPLKRGYATAGGDGGHQGGPGFDGRFALDEEALRNYGRESVKKIHDVAVEIIMARYSLKPARTYFVGNSQGGHEALIAAAYYAADYDGVVANYPAYNITLLHLASLNVGHAVYSDNGAGWLSPEKTKFLTDAVRKACDPLDGATDGIISNLAACHRAFNIDTVRTTLRCGDGKDSGTNCLSDAQIEAVARIASPYRPGFAVAGADQFTPWALLEGSSFVISNFGARRVPGNPPTSMDALLYNAGAATVKYIITRDPNYDPLTFRPAAYRARIDEVAKILDVTDTDLTPFKLKGGKLILAHGTEDDFIAPGNTDAYYERHLAKQGMAAMASFVRYYKVPGLSHGFGTFNAKYDDLTALDHWLGSGHAPEELIAVDENADGRGRTRPMCVYPRWPKFTGKFGDSLDEARNFTCAVN
ncbi:MAG TPA: tannase/feruloyl esterase family alpha/beta hydrolase [Steroidobacteraceae bacterium]|nr:tannase/feruloyl esterase family alpha/beta hydrolase [Steroidobacteraceae bacterium]